MSAIDNLAKYKKWLEDFKIHAPFAKDMPASEWHTERGPERFDLTTPGELVIARQIRENVLGKTK